MAIIRVEKIRSKPYVHAYVDREFLQVLKNIYVNVKSNPKRTKLLTEQLLKNKMGSEFDVFYIIAAFFVICILAVLVSFIYSQINVSLQAADTSVIPADVKSMSASLSNKIPTWLDTAAVVMFIGSAIVAFVLASLVRVHYVFIIIYIPVMILNIIFGALLKDAFELISTNPMLADQAAKFIFVSGIFAVFPWVILGISLLLMWVMYKAGGPVVYG